MYSLRTVDGWFTYDQAVFTFLFYVIQWSMDCFYNPKSRYWLRRVTQQQKTLKALQDISPIDHVHYKVTGSKIQEETGSSKVDL